MKKRTLSSGITAQELHKKRMGECIMAIQLQAGALYHQAEVLKEESNIFFAPEEKALYHLGEAIQEFSTEVTGKIITGWHNVPRNNNK